MLTLKDIAHRTHTDIETVKDVAKRTHKVGKVWRVDDDPDKLAGSSTKWETVTRYLEKQNRRERESSADNAQPQAEPKQKPQAAQKQKPEPKPQAEPKPTAKQEPATVEPPADTQVIPEVPPKATDTAHVAKVSESVIPAMVKFRELPGMADVTRRDVRKIRDSHGRKVGYVVREGKAVRILWREWYRHDDASLDATVRELAESWAKAA